MVKGNGFYHINEYSLLLPSKRSEKPIESNVISGRGPYSVAFPTKKATEIEYFLKMRCFYCKKGQGNP